MLAFVLHGVGDIRMEERPVPEIKDDEVLLKVRACGICGSDIPRIFDTGAHVHPLIPGHEFSGVVEEVGANVDPSRKGMRAGVFPLIPCGKCPQCQKKQYEMCENYGYLGSRRDGAFAEYVAVPEWNLTKIADGISFETAAMLEPMAVAVHASRRAALLPFGYAGGKDEQPFIAVCGLGTIGLLLSLFLQDAGYRRLILIGNKEAQRELAAQAGIDVKGFFNSKDPDAEDGIRAFTSGNGADVYFECVGSQASVSLGLRIAAPKGRVVFVGNPYGDMLFSRQDYWQILRNQLTVSGTWNSSFTHEETDDWHYLLSRIAKGNASFEKLITKRLSLSRLGEGLDIMRHKTEPYGKIMVLP